MTTVQDWLSNTTTFGYDVNSNLTTETLPAASGVVDTFTFDAADRLMAIADKKGNSTLFAATYTRDNANQLTSDSSQPSSTKAYKYTTLNQVCYAGSASTTACTSPPSGSIPYKYDAADNLNQTGTTQQVFNNADELCWTGSTTGSCASPPSGATTYAYDTRGNRVTVTPPSGGPITLTYDQANRLTAYGTAGTYAYNGDGLRMSKTVGTTTQYLWDPSAGLPLLIKDGSTAYIYGPGGLPSEQISGSTALWLHHDQVWSTRLVTNSAGSNVATYSFDPYGKLGAITGAITNPFRFAGQYQDAESGLYYLRTRYYDTTSGQFVSSDPRTFQTGHRYGYVDDNPLNGTDPSGLCTGFDPGCWAGVVGPQLAQLPRAVLHDASQGQANFIRNVQDPAFRPLVVVGAVSLLAAAVIATGGLILSAPLPAVATAGALQAGSVSAGCVVRLGLLGLLLFVGGAIVFGDHDPGHLADPDSPLVPPQPPPYLPAPSVSPSPSPSLYGPFIR